MFTSTNLLHHLKRLITNKKSEPTKSTVSYLHPPPNYHNAKIANWGRCTEGNLGREVQATSSELPEYVNIEGNVIHISARGWHTIVVTDRGCYGFGWNEHGNLGLGHTSKTVSSPTLIPNISHITQCATGEGHTLFLDRNGVLYGCGWSANGQITSNMSLDTNHPHVIPMDYSIPSDQYIHKIVCGYRHSVFLTSRGAVYIADKKLHKAGGFIKHPLEDFIVDIDATMHATIMMSRFGHIQLLGDKDLKLPPQIALQQEKNLVYFKAMSIGRTHVLLLTDRNTVWIFGTQNIDFTNDEKHFRNDGGIAELRPELLNGTVVQISAGRNFSLILTDQNLLYSFGIATYRQLGRTTYENKFIDTVDFSKAPIPLGMEIMTIIAGCDSATVVISHLGNVEQYVKKLFKNVDKRIYVDVQIITVRETLNGSTPTIYKF
jgi:alpha-tubulin suppressor-like RCC1 family protein